MENNNVLFVDDEIHIIKAIKRGLHKEAYNKFFATSARDALLILEREDIHVIVTDMKMPGMTGLELLTIVKEKYPDIIKIILSGYTQLQQIIVTINRIDIYKFITKPWDMEGEFQAVIISAIELYNTKKENERLKVSLSKQNALYQTLLRKNDDKLKLMKNDFDFIETLNRVMVNVYYLMGVKLGSGVMTDERYKEELDFIQMRLSEAIKMMPTSHDEFNIRILQDDLNRFLKKKVVASGASRITITSKTEAHIYRGAYKVLSYTLSSILGLYFDATECDEFSLVISEKINEATDQVELLCLLRSSNNQVINDRIRYQSIRTFYSNLIHAYGGLLSIENRNDDTLVLMRFPIIITNEEVDDE